MMPQSSKEKIPILMYHSISQHATLKFRPFTVSPELFAAHMAYLHEHRYTPITVTQFVNALAQGVDTLPARPVVLTFDDGFADFFTSALSILKRYSFTATLYVVTGYIGSTSKWLLHEGENARPMLTWEQLTQINDAGIECGAHSHYHPQLDTLPLSMARDEIMKCKDLLETNLKQRVSSFAYPYGYHSTTIKQLVREAGYQSACAVKYEMSSVNADRFALARLIVRADTHLDTFSALLMGDSSSAVARMCKRAQTPVWQFARRCSALAVRHISGRLPA